MFSPLFKSILFFVGFGMFYHTQATAQNAIYDGGNGDGFDIGCYLDVTPSAPTNNSNIFIGGNSDGFDIGCYLDVTPPTPINNSNIFIGGNSDGFNIGCYLDPTIPITNNPSVFIGGGQGDGFDINCYTIEPASPPMRHGKYFKFGKLQPMSFGN